MMIFNGGRGRNRRRLTVGGPILLVALWCWSVVAEAVPVYRSALADAQWQRQASIWRCQLYQPLGVWGSAGFERRSGSTDRFFIHLKEGHLIGRSLRVTALSPLWSNTNESFDLGRMTLDAAGYGGGETVIAMQLALEKGQRVWVESLPFAGVEAHVMLEPVGFRQAVSGYQHCTQTLMPGFEEFQRTSIFFPASGQVLAPAEMAKLERLAIFLSHQADPPRIFIDGHTDNYGNAADNLELSRQRALQVAAWLVERGVDKERLMIRWHGEKYPVVPNIDDSSRDRNRRVTLRLESMADPES